MIDLHVVVEQFPDMELSWIVVCSTCQHGVPNTSTTSSINKLKVHEECLYMGYFQNKKTIESGQINIFFQHQAFQYAVPDQLVFIIIICHDLVRLNRHIQGLLATIVVVDHAVYLHILDFWRELVLVLEF